LDLFLSPAAFFGAFADCLEGVLAMVGYQWGFLRLLVPFRNEDCGLIKRLSKNALRITIESLHRQLV
jgi:hypothetical protein